MSPRAPRRPRRDTWLQEGPPDVLVDEDRAADDRALENTGDEGPSLFARAVHLVRRAPTVLIAWLVDQAQQHPYAVFAAVYAFMRAMGVTVRSGNQGLLFSFGRVRGVIEPGFRFLVPFLQIVRIVPTRHRTLDLEGQKVATLDGLVYRVHATLVWRIVDIEKALVEIGDLEQGMRDALAISVWEVLVERGREDLRVSEAIDEELAAKMKRWLQPWGVVVERAGFQSIAPSPSTLALIQLRERVRERERAAGLIAAGGDGLAGAGGGAALGLIGTPRFPRRRQRRALRREIESRYRRRVEVLHRRAAALDLPFQGLRGRALAQARAGAIKAAKRKAKLAADRGIKRPWSVSASTER